VTLRDEQMNKRQVSLSESVYSMDNETRTFLKNVRILMTARSISWFQSEFKCFGGVFLNFAF
jgi:hypothetical protein